ncbi:MAG TPA: hypothetical protein VMB53_11800 [Gaiellaceae bacterium]|nr:hypothetical protein [Gaiellaceae bacterium]
MADLTTIAELGTAAGTLVLAVSTFAAVRSGNRSARIAEATLLAGLRPLIVPTRREDPAQKIGFADNKWLTAPGGGAAVEIADDAIYLGIALRNVGNGIAILHGWDLYEFDGRPEDPRPQLERFHRLTRDLYIAPGDIGFWQGVLRDPSSAEFDDARRAIESGERIVVDVLYGDQQGLQRMVTRFTLTPHDDAWLATIARHWNVDGADPRQR